MKKPSAKRSNWCVAWVSHVYPWPHAWPRQRAAAPPLEATELGAAPGQRAATENPGLPPSPA